jgi:hypothetical protein
MALLFHYGNNSVRCAALLVFCVRPFPNWCFTAGTSEVNMPRMRKRLPLVCQHLENISRDALENYLDVIRTYVRHRQGVYAL